MSYTINGTLQTHLTKEAIADMLELPVSSVSNVYCGGEEYWDSYTSFTITVNNVDTFDVVKDKIECMSLA